jgi:hypothetical protein
MVGRSLCSTCFPLSNFQRLPTCRHLRLLVGSSVFVLLFCLTSWGQFTGAWLDAASPIFTANTNGDMCKAINNAYLSTAFSTGTFFTGTIDARAFTGVQACNTDPFSGGTQNHYVYLLLNSNVQIVTSVGWFTPQKAHVIDGGAPGDAGTPGPSNLDVGAEIIGCGPGLTTYWDSGSRTCKIPFQGTTFTVSVAQITLNPNLTFNVHHGPFPIGSYNCILCIGGAQYAVSGVVKYGWNTDAFGAVIRGVRVDLGGNQNIFGVYTQNQEETSEWTHIRCGDYSSLGTNNGSACAFVDRVEAATGQSGPSNSVIDQWSVRSDLSTDGLNNYGIVSEGEDITVEITGLTCSTRNPVAAVTGVDTSVGSITSVQVLDGGMGCTGSAVATAWYPSATGVFSGTPTNPIWGNTRLNGGAMFTVNMTGTSVSQIIVDPLHPGSNYPTSFVSGPRAITNITIVGENSGSGRLNGGLVFDGKATGTTNSVHCEKMVSSTTGVGSGDCVQSGTFGFQGGGVFSNVTANLDVQGAAIHFGKGIDNNQLVTSTAALSGPSSTTELIQDDLNLPGAPISPSTCDNLGAGGGTFHSGIVATYIPASLMRCGTDRGYYLPELATGAAAPAGLSTFDAIYGKSSPVHWPAFNPSSAGEELFASLNSSGSWSSGDLVQFNSSSTGELAEAHIAASSVGTVSGTLAAHQIVTGAGGNAAQVESNPQLAAASTPAAVTQGYLSAGTTAGLIAKINGTNDTVATVGTLDTEAIGIVVSLGGGVAQVAIAGTASCTFDNTSSAKDYVQISGTAAGKCHDVGSTPPTSGGTIIGRVADGGSPGSHNVAIALTPSGGAVATLCAGATANIPPSTTEYIGFGTANSTESKVLMPVPIAGSAVAIHATLGSTPPYSVTFTMHNNASPLSPSLTCSTSATSCDVTTAGASITEGSNWDIVVSVGPAGAGASINYAVCIKVIDAS